MAKPITGKTHVGERREKRPNGDIYVYERITTISTYPENQSEARQGFNKNGDGLTTRSSF